MEQISHRKLRSGWTTGACATAAAKAAHTALLTGEFADPVCITLPGGERPCFALALSEKGEGWARAGVVKDAGDDPDVTHGALIIVTLRVLPEGAGIVFKAGSGVGVVTLPGLPVAVGEPAINPAPRLMISDALRGVAAAHGARCDLEVEISIPGGEKLAARTMNPRLGVRGGLSVLGTSGVVRPYSCAAWIAAIREGVDVARALGLAHIAACTGRVSEAAARTYFGLPEQALIDMGDFAGGVLKYVRAHPVQRLTIAGGFAKMAKLGRGALDLHSARSSVDFSWLAELAGMAEISRANTARAALEMAHDAGIDLAAPVARAARDAARGVLRDAPVALDVLVTDRQGRVIAHAG